jgi:hypothetical protein
MSAPEENMQSVRTFAEEVIGSKNLKYAIWLFGRSDRIASWPIAGTPAAHRVAA